MNKSNVFKNPVVNIFYMLLIILQVNISYSQSGWQVQTIGKPLNSVNFVNALTGFAAGSNGVIYKTTNSAATWECYDTKSSVTINAVYFPSVNTGFAAGNAGYIYRTINSGTNWSQVPSGTTNTLNSVFFIDDNTGWAVGSSGRIIKSTNGGASWLTQISGTTNQLNSVFFTSVLNGICAGDNIVLRTTDGGANWVSNSSVGGNSVIMVNATTGFIAFNYEQLYKTTNGGINWLTIPTNTGLSCWGLSYTTANDIWSSTIEGSIIRTTNGGNNWIVQFNSSSNALYSINNKSNFGCAVGLNGTIITTTNSGTNWSLNTRGTEDNSLTDIHFVNTLTGWVIGWSGVIYSTTTGGRIWTKQNSNTTTNLNSVYFTSAQTGYVVGNSGILVFTTNGGSSWTSTGISVENLNSIHFINASTGIACGNNGALLRTTNAGASWNVIVTGITTSLTDISFPSSTTGYIVSSFLPLLKTTNSGQNWIQLSIPIPGGISISFVNDNTGYINGANSGQLIRTTNGGFNWVNVTGSQGFYTSFRSAALGWVVGGTTDSMLITGTNDGGTSWNRYTSKIVGLVSGIYMFSDSTGWCISSSGVIFRTSNGGGILTDINDPVNTIPEKYNLFQNYPNPFNPVTNIEISVPSESFVKLVIYDITGREIETLVNTDLKAGVYKIDWNAVSYPSGVYFYKIETEEFTETKKMILVK